MIVKTILDLKVVMRWQMLASVLILLLSQPSTSLADVLVISNNGESQALLVDPSDFKLLASLPTGKGPHEIAVSADGRLAYVAVTGSQQEPGHTITVLDLGRRTVKATFDLGSYKQPHDLRLSRDGALLWVTCAPSKAVLEIEARTGKIIRAWKLDKDGAWMLSVTPDGRKIYTANLEGRSVSIIDRKANTLRSIEFDSTQIGMDISPNGREVWVHHADKNQLSVIDVATDKVVATLASAGQGFGRVKFTPDGKNVLVPQSQSKNLVIFEAASRRLIENIPLSAPPKVITVSSDGKLAFITSPSANHTLVIDLLSRKEIAAYPTGKLPDAIVWASTAGVRYRSQVAFTIPEKDLIPEGIAYDPLTGRFFVSSTYKRKIVRVDRRGVSGDFTAEAQDGLTGVVGMKVDARRRELWAISSDAGENMPMKHMVASHRGRSSVFKYDLRTGKLIKKYVLDNQPQPHFLNDLTINERGDVFISDSLAHEIYTITRQKDELEVFLRHEQVRNPNGIDLSPDGEFLFVAVRGNVAVIRLSTREITTIPIPTNETFWADGLYYYRNSLIAVGWREGRHAVTQYFLNKTFDRIEGFRVIEAGHPAFSQPTTGVIVGDHLYYIANSQLQIFRRLFAANEQVGLARLKEVIVLKTAL
jgi:DNA-binding beta-propeller fold protein YncE